MIDTPDVCIWSMGIALLATLCEIALWLCGPWTFDHIHYDADADVAYLSIGPPRRSVGEQTPEGHVTLFDEDTGELCGITLIGIRRILDGELSSVTVPSPQEINSERLGDLVCA